MPAEVEGRLNLNDFAERAGFALPHGPYDTVGGFLMAALGRLAVLGDEVTVSGADREWRLVGAWSSTAGGWPGSRCARRCPSRPRRQPRWWRPAASPR